MRKKVLLYALIAVLLASLNVGTLASQNLFSPISKSTYESSKKLFRKYYDKKADVCVLLPCFVLIKGYPTIVILKDGTIHVNLDNRKYKMDCSDGLYESLVELSRQAVMTASFTNYTVYPDSQDDFLFYKDKGVTYISGSGTSSETMDLFRRLADAVREQDKTGLEAEKAVADSLSRVFRTYYPKEAISVSPTISSAGDKSYSQLEIYASVPFGPHILLKLKFEYEAMRDYKKDAKPYMDKYENILREVAYSLLVNPDLTDNLNLISIIVDESVSAPKITKSGFVWYDITLRESDMTIPTLLSLIQQAK